MQRAFARRPHRPRVIDVLPEIRPVIDAGNYHVRLFRQKFVQRHDHAIRRRPVDGPLALRDLVTHNRLPQRQRLCRPALLAARGNDTHRREVTERLRQRSKPLRLIPIVICLKYVRHGSIVFQRFAFSKTLDTRLNSGRRVGSCCVSEQEMVGTTGFQPATPRTPSVRATRLRYVPTERNTQRAKSLEPATWPTRPARAIKLRYVPTE